MRRDPRWGPERARSIQAAVAGRRGQVGGDDRLRATSQGDFNQRGLFQIDLEQVDHAAEHFVPRRLRCAAGALQDLLDADSQSLLASFEILENALARAARAALFAA